MRKQARSNASNYGRDSEESDEENLSSPSKSGGQRTSATRSGYSTINVFLIAAIVLSWVITSLLIIFSGKTVHDPPTSSISEKMAQYERLVRHTSHLIQQYKQLSGSDKLPADLTLPRKVSSEPDTHQSANGDAERKKSSKSAQSHSARTTAVNPKPTTFPSTPRDLVIGLAEGISVDDVTIFVKSLRNVSACAIMLFVPPGKGGDPYRGLANDFRVKLVAAKRDVYPRSVTNPLLSTPAALRWLYFRYFFSEQDGYRLIFHRALVVDLSRGAAFLQDPFLSMPLQEDRLHVYPIAMQSAFSLSDADSAQWNLHTQPAPLSTRTRAAEAVLKPCMARNARVTPAELVLSSSVILGSMERIWRLIDVLGAVYASEGPDSPSLSLFTPADRFQFPQCLSKLSKEEREHRLSALDDAIFSLVVSRHLVYVDDPARQRNRRKKSTEEDEDDVSPLVIHGSEDSKGGSFVVSVKQAQSVSQSDLTVQTQTALRNPQAIFGLFHVQATTIVLRYPLSSAVHAALHAVSLPYQQFSGRQTQISTSTSVSTQTQTKPALTLFTDQWTETRQCVNNYVYSLDRDVFLGECDLDSKQVQSVTDCCALCRDRDTDTGTDRDKHCTSFTFLPHIAPSQALTAKENEQKAGEMAVDSAAKETEAEGEDDYVAVFAQNNAQTPTTTDRDRDEDSNEGRVGAKDGLGAGVCFFKACSKEKVQSLLVQRQTEERPGVVSAYLASFAPKNQQA